MKFGAKRRDVACRVSTCGRGMPRLYCFPKLYSRLAPNGRAVQFSKMNCSYCSVRNNILVEK